LINSGPTATITLNSHSDLDNLLVPIVFLLEAMSSRRKPITLHWKW